MDAAVAEAFLGRDRYRVRRKRVGQLDEESKLRKSLAKIGVRHAVELLHKALVY